MAVEVARLWRWRGYGVASSRSPRWGATPGGGKPAVCGRPGRVPSKEVCLRVVPKPRKRLRPAKPYQAPALQKMLRPKKHRKGAEKP